MRKEGEVTKGEGAKGEGTKGEGTKGEGKGKRRKRSYKRSDEAVKRRLKSSKAKLKAKRLARNDGNPMPSPMPMEKRGGKKLPPKQKQNAGKGKVKARKPLLRRTFRVTQRPTPSGQDYVVAITVDGRPATEEDSGAKWPLWHLPWPSSSPPQLRPYLHSR